MNRRIITAVLIGLAVGSAVAFFVGNDSVEPKNEAREHFWSFLVGLTATGALVGVQKLAPILVGTLSGALMLSVAALIVGPKDGWMVMVLFFYAVGGAIGGFMIGLASRWPLSVWEQDETATQC